LHRSIDIKAMDFLNLNAYIIKSPSVMAVFKPLLLITVPTFQNKKAPQT